MLSTMRLRAGAQSLVMVLGPEEGETVDGDSWTQTRMGFRSLFPYHFKENNVHLVQGNEM